MPVAAPLAAVGSFLGSSAGLATATIGTGLASAALSSSAAQKAAKTQANAATNAAQQQYDMFNTIRGDLSPYRDLGGTALPAYSRLLGLTGQTTLGPTGGAAIGMAAHPTAQPAVPVVDPATGLPITTGGATNGAPTTASGAYGYDPSNFDAKSYLRDNPDIGRAYTQFISGQSPWQDMYAGVTSPEEFAWRHYQLQGITEGRDAATGVSAALANTPGYQFTRDQGIQSINRQLGSKGLTGAQAKGIARFVTGLADTTYGEQVNRLRDAATMGQNAANQTGAFGQTAATNAGNAQIGGANATAAGQVGTANAIGSALSSIPSALLTNKILGSGIYSSPGVPGGASAGGWGSGYSLPTAGTFNFTG